MKITGKINPILLYSLICLTPLTETIYSIALPNIAKQLELSGFIAQFATAAYYFGFAIGILIWGQLSDIYGRRPIILLGLIIYIIALLGLAYDSTASYFLFFRVLQAFGISIGSVVAQAMARDSFQGWELAAFYSTAAIINAIAPSVGSMIGGYILLYFDRWNYIFYFLIVLTGVLLLIQSKFLPETNHYTNVKRSGFIKVVKVMLSDKILLAYSCLIGIYNGLCFSFYIQAPFIFIERLGSSPEHYSRWFFLLSGANLTGAIFGKYLVKRFVSGVKIINIGICCSIIGSLSLLMSNYVLLSEHSRLIWKIMVFVPMAIHFLGHSMVMPMCLRFALEHYTKVLGTAGSIFGSLYYLITATISSLVAIMHSDAIGPYAYLHFTLISVSFLLITCLKHWQQKERNPYNFNS